MRGEKVAEQTRALTPLLKQQADQQFQQQQQMAQPQMPPSEMAGQMGQLPPGEQMGGGTDNIGMRMRELARSRQASLQDNGEFPVLDMTGGGM